MKSMNKYFHYSFIAELIVDGCLFSHEFYSPYTAFDFWRCHENLNLSIVVYKDSFYLNTYYDLFVFGSDFCGVKNEKYEK